MLFLGFKIIRYKNQGKWIVYRNLIFYSNLKFDSCFLKIVVLILQKIETSKYEYPNQIYKVPVKTNFFNHQVAAATLVSTCQHIYRNDDIDQYTGEYVETMETGNGKEQVGKLMCGAVLHRKRDITRKKLF